jgi:hypothetical protein
MMIELFNRLAAGTQLEEIEEWRDEGGVHV